MKKLSTTLLADIVQSKRKSLKMTQAQLSELTGINRAQLSRLEQEDYCPLISQLEKLGDVLDFDIDDVFVNTAASKIPSPSRRIRNMLSQGARLRCPSRLAGKRPSPLRRSSQSRCTCSLLGASLLAGRLG